MPPENPDHHIQIISRKHRSQAYFDDQLVCRDFPSCTETTQNKSQMPPEILITIFKSYHANFTRLSDAMAESRAKFPHSPILHYACRSLLTENNGKNNAIAVGLCAVFVVSRWRNKGLHTLNRMHNEVWSCAEI